MRARTVLQPVITMSSDTTQDVRYAKRVGGKSAVVIVNVYRHPGGGGTITFDIETAAHLRQNAATNLFWKSCVSGGGNTIATGVTGAVRFKLADLGELVRYNVTTSTSWPSGGIDFDVTIYWADT